MTKIGSSHFQALAERMVRDGKLSPDEARLLATAHQKGESLSTAERYQVELTFRRVADAFSPDDRATMNRVIGGGNQTANGAADDVAGRADARTQPKQGALAWRVAQAGVQTAQELKSSAWWTNVRASMTEPLLFAAGLAESIRPDTATLLAAIGDAYAVTARVPALVQDRASKAFGVKPLLVDNALRTLTGEVTNTVGKLVETATRSFDDVVQFHLQLLEVLGVDGAKVRDWPYQFERVFFSKVRTDAKDIEVTAEIHSAAFGAHVVKYGFNLDDDGLPMSGRQLGVAPPAWALQDTRPHALVDDAYINDVKSLFDSVSRT